MKKNSPATRKFLDRLQSQPGSANAPALGQGASKCENNEPSQTQIVGKHNRSIQRVNKGLQKTRILWSRDPCREGFHMPFGKYRGRTFANVPPLAYLSSK
jgi:hypothetical protein